MSDALINGLVAFYGDELTTVCHEGTGRIYCVPREICLAVGIDWSSQHLKLTQDIEFSVYITRGDITTSAGSAETILLDVEALFGWLMGIQAKRIKSEAIRERLLLYKRECITVLRDYWMYGHADNPRIQSRDESEIDKLAKLIGVGYTKLVDTIAGEAQRVNSALDEQNKKIDKKAPCEQVNKIQDRVDALEDHLEKVDTVVAGPHPPGQYEGPVATVWNALYATMLKEGLSGRRPLLFVRTMQAFMYKNYAPVKEVPFECLKVPSFMADHTYTQKDFHEAFTRCGEYGNPALRHLKPVDRLKAEIEYARTNGKVREVPRPKDFASRRNQ